MNHSIEDFVAKIKVLADKATLLHNSQYRLTEREIKYSIEDIQSLAREIYSDKLKS